MFVPCSYRFVSKSRHLVHRLHRLEIVLIPRFADNKYQLKFSLSYFGLARPREREVRRQRKVELLIIPENNEYELIRRTCLGLRVKYAVDVKIVPTLSAQMMQSASFQTKKASERLKARDRSLLSDIRASESGSQSDSGEETKIRIRFRLNTPVDMRGVYIDEALTSLAPKSSRPILMVVTITPQRTPIVRLLSE